MGNKEADGSRENESIRIEGLLHEQRKPVHRVSVEEFE